MQISAATIDRTVAATRASIDGQRKLRTAWVRPSGAAFRFAPLPTGETHRQDSSKSTWLKHCGGSKAGGDFVHTLTLTDIASGWTECVAMPVRNQALVVEAYASCPVDSAARLAPNHLQREFELEAPNRKWVV